MTKVAVLEVEFESSMMIDDESLVELYGGDWLKPMQYLYSEEGIGIFGMGMKIVAIRNKEDYED